CQSKCTRINYERPLMIREIKRYVADKFDRHLPQPKQKNGIKVAIIGAGPTGLSCAHYLAMEGFAVEMFEANGFLGGMAADGIPVFRLDDGSLQKDIDGIIFLGVKVHMNEQISAAKFQEIRDTNDYVYVAVGAQESLPLNIPGIDAEGVFDQLTYLSRVRRMQDIPKSKKIIVIGAGNSAMDAARTAKRVVGKDGEVTIVYRRTRREMPCDPEEVRGALEEGIELVELASPEAVVVKDGKVAGLTVNKMKLGEPDESGRARPIKIQNSESVIEADLIIPAIGQQVVLDFYPEDKLEVNQATYETTLDNVFAGGDAMRGASSLINAIADGQNVALQIMEKSHQERHGFYSPRDDRQPDLNILQIKQARRGFGPDLPEVAAESRINFDLFMTSLTDDAAVQEASRCLQCDLVCNICTTVCPNRSNMYYPLTEAVTVPLETAVSSNGTVEIVRKGSATISQPYQIINIGDYCNECGNCTLFCPSAGDPYKDKPKFHITEESFANADFGFIYSDAQSMKIKVKGGDGIAVLTEANGGFTYEDDQMSVSLNPDTLEAQKVLFKDDKEMRADLEPIVQYIVLYKNVRPNLPVANK
ncbi:MAG: FAD-dependent oxidoreductase, partial [Desulfuromusa sp.]